MNYWDAFKEAWKAGRQAWYENLNGPAPKPGRIWSPMEERAAVHEVGHALTAWTGHPYVTSINKITIEDSIGSGMVLYTRSGHKNSAKIDLLWCECMVNLGGIAAEMVRYKKTRSGPAARDLENARDNAKRIVKLGGTDNAPWDTAEVARLADTPFDVSKMLRSIKSGTPEAQVMNRAYDRAKFLIMTNEKTRARLLEALLRHGTMGPAEVKAVLGARHFHMRSVG